MSENRKSRRYALTALAEVTLPSGKTVPTYVSNISREGLGIYFRQPLDSGTNLGIKLFYRDMGGQMKSKAIDGEVKWAFNGFYALGVSLKGINDKENADLAEFIDSVEEREGQNPN